MNQELNNNNSSVKVLTTLVIILIVLVLCLGGYLVYDKVVKNDNNVNINESVDNNKIEEQPVLLTDQEAYEKGQELYDFGNRALYNQEFKTSQTYVEGLGYEVLNYQEVTDKFTVNNQVKSTMDSAYVSFSSRLIYSNGKYYLNSGGLGGNIKYISTELKIVEKTENSIIYNAISKYCDVAYVSDSTVCNNIENKTDEFKIEKENGTWKIAKITNPRG